MGREAATRWSRTERAGVEAVRQCGCLHRYLRRQALRYGIRQIVSQPFRVTTRKQFMDSSSPRRVVCDRQLCATAMAFVMLMLTCGGLSARAEPGDTELVKGKLTPPKEAPPKDTLPKDALPKDALP